MNKVSFYRGAVILALALMATILYTAATATWNNEILEEECLEAKEQVTKLTQVVSAYQSLTDSQADLLISCMSALGIEPEVTQYEDMMPALELTIDSIQKEPGMGLTN